MSLSSSGTPILDETMIQPDSEPEQTLQTSEQPTINTLPSLSKCPRDNETNLVMPPNIKQVYKEKGKVIDPPPSVPFIPPPWEEKKPIMDQPTLTPKQL